VIDRWFLSGAQQYPDGIDAQAIHPDPVLGQPQQTELSKLSAFAPCDCFKWITKPEPRTALHLDEHQRPGIRIMSDDVELTLVAPPVAIKHLPPETDHMFDSVFFSNPPDCLELPTNNHKITSCNHSGQGARPATVFHRKASPADLQKIVLADL
jgi:hypothetical protein